MQHDAHNTYTTGSSRRFDVYLKQNKQKIKNVKYLHHFKKLRIFEWSHESHKCCVR